MKRVWSMYGMLERGLVDSVIAWRWTDRVQNAKLVRQLGSIMLKLKAFVTERLTQRLMLLLARRSRKRGHLACTMEGRLVRVDPTGPLTEIMEEKGYVPGNYALGEAGLRGQALELYRLLKHGTPHSNSVLGQLAIRLYGGAF